MMSGVQVARLVMMMQRLCKFASVVKQKMIANVSHRHLLLENPGNKLEAADDHECDVIRGWGR